MSTCRRVFSCSFMFRSYITRLQGGSFLSVFPSSPSTPPIHMATDQHWHVSRQARVLVAATAFSRLATDSAAADCTAASETPPSPPHCYVEFRNTFLSQPAGCRCTTRLPALYFCNTRRGAGVPPAFPHCIFVTIGGVQPARHRARCGREKVRNSCFRPPLMRDRVYLITANMFRAMRN